MKLSLVAILFSSVVLSVSSQNIPSGLLSPSPPPSAQVTGGLLLPVSGFCSNDARQCWLENIVTGAEISLTSGGGTTAYDVVSDNGRSVWTVRCDVVVDDDVQSVTFRYHTVSGDVGERVERTAPYYMGGDENGIASGVAGLSECGVTFVDVIWWGVCHIGLFPTGSSLHSNASTSTYFCSLIVRNNIWHLFQ